MITPSDITKTKLTLLSIEISCFCADNGLDFVVFLGENILPFQPRNSLMDALYDLFQLIDSLPQAGSLNKIFRELIGRVKRMRKMFSPSEYARAYVVYCQTHNSSIRNYVTGFSKILVLLFEVIYEGVYAGPNSEAPHYKSEIHSNALIESGVLSSALFYIACTGISTLEPYIAETQMENCNTEFCRWCMDRIVSPSETYSMDLIRYLAHEYKHKNILDVFSMDNQLDILRKTRGEDLVNQFSRTSYIADKDPIGQASKYVDDLFSNFASNRTSWTAHLVIFQVALLAKEFREWSAYMHDYGWINAGVRMYLPQMVRSNPWKDRSGSNTQNAKWISSDKIAETVRKYLPCDLLKRRKFYVRNGGLYCNFTPSINGIDSLYIEEVHDGDVHYIWTTAVCKTDIGSSFFRHNAFPIEDISVGIESFLCEMDYYVLGILLWWLGVLDEWHDGFSGSFTDIHEVLVFSLLASLIGETKETIEQSQIRYSHEKRNSQKSVFSGDAPSRHYTGSYVIEKKEIGNYIRRLPLGQEASGDAMLKAKKRCMEIPKGYTFVSSFVREQRVSEKCN